jgi:type II secretory pathway pseudopilin PulG
VQGEVVVTDVKLRNETGFAIIDLVFVCGIIGILSGIALPKIAQAKGTASVASAIASVRVIGSGQVTFAITCGSGFYAPSLTALGTPPLGGGGAAGAFLNGELALADTVTKSNFTFTLSSTPYPAAPDTCNGLGAGVTGQAFKAGADSLDPKFPRFFAINANNIIWEDAAPLYPVMPEAGDPPTGHAVGR